MGGEQTINPDEQAAAAEFNARSAAAARDMIENGNSNAPIQEGVEHGPHRPIEGLDADLNQLNEHAHSAVDAKMDGFIPEATKQQLLKENDDALRGIR